MSSSRSPISHERGGEAITTEAHDRRIVRELAARVADIAALPQTAERRRLWADLNGRHPDRPMVLIYGGIPCTRWRRRVSAWSRVEDLAAWSAGRYVPSHRPSTSAVAMQGWEPEAARAQLRDALAASRRSGCGSEISMNAANTVRHRPQRLWEWERIAMEEAARAA